MEVSILGRPHFPIIKLKEKPYAALPRLTAHNSLPTWGTSRLLVAPLHVLRDRLEVVALVPQLALEGVCQHIERLAERLELGLGLLAHGGPLVDVAVRVPLERGALVARAQLLLRRLRLCGRAHARAAEQRVQLGPRRLLYQKLRVRKLLVHATLLRARP
eukprot:scaffold4023_cov51-Phaeocystis_antarctica.AAC.1